MADITEVLERETAAWNAHDPDIEVKDPIVSGNVAAQEWRAAGTHGGEPMGSPATGRRMEILACGFAEIGDDGLFRRGANDWNAVATMQQLGVLPAEAAATA